MKTKTEIKLTQEQIARIFMMYPGAYMIFEKSGRIEKLLGGYLDDNRFILYYPVINRFPLTIINSVKFVDYDIYPFKLILTPIEKISDADAVFICEIQGWDHIEFIHFTKNKIDGFYDFDEFNYLSHQFLIQKGYAVPLFIAPDHPANGKTAIELGLAIDKEIIN